MTINLTPAELREFVRLWRTEPRTMAETSALRKLERRIPTFLPTTLAIALADAMERVEQLTNEARLANNAVGSHANEIVMLSAKINDLKTVLKRAYNAMAEPHGDWKDIREAKSLIEIRAMLGGEPT